MPRPPRQVLGCKQVIRSHHGDQRRIWLRGEITVHRHVGNRAVEGIREFLTLIPLRQVGHALRGWRNPLDRERHARKGILPDLSRKDDPGESIWRGADIESAISGAASNQFDELRRNHPLDIEHGGFEITVVIEIFNLPLQIIAGAQDL